MKNKNTSPLEIEEQKAFIHWLKVKKLLYCAIPNGSKRTRWQQQQAKAEGVISGAPDIIVCLDNGITLFIEMKRKKGGTISAKQKAMGDALTKLNHRYKVCRGAQEAIDFTSEYLQ